MSSKNQDDKVEKILYSYEDRDVEEENRILKATVEKLDGELKKLKSPPLMVCEIADMVSEEEVIIKIPNGNRFLSNVASDCETLKAGDHVLVDQRSLNILRKVKTQKKYNVEKFVIINKPGEKWMDVGGLEDQKQDVREVIELPLKKPELFRKVGIRPPKGILLHGPPGTGKTLLAKAVANSTEATFIEVAASELVQKFIGEGAKLIKDIFQLAKDKAPSIIFIDELDALAAKRMEVGTSGEREVNRTFMQLLSELDGFKPLGDVKVIGATNRKDILDPAVIRPGRLDRLIHVGLPAKEGRKQIFKIHTKGMNLNKIDFDEIVSKTEDFSGAEIKAVCTEAGYFAIRENRSKVKKKDFLRGIEKVKREEALEGEDYLKMFG